MPKFLTIGYGDEAGYQRTPEPVRQAAHAHDAELVREGAIVGMAGQPVQVRNPDHTGVETQEGPYLKADLPIAGFALIQAANLQEAIKLASESPCAVAHGVIEVWPLHVAIDT
ncbi:MAG: transcription initiation protein [Sphingomonadaceae bacterium]|nr:transcription initiation protein [Sphingomonadaceae bacterium]